MLVDTGAAEPRMPRVSIIIPTLGGDLIVGCLESLRRNISSAISYEIVVVANGPSAAQLATAPELSSPVVRAVTSAANLGLAAGATAEPLTRPVSFWCC